MQEFLEFRLEIEVLARGRNNCGWREFNGQIYITAPGLEVGAQRRTEDIQFAHGVALTQLNNFMLVGIEQCPALLGWMCSGTPCLRRERIQNLLLQDLTISTT